MNEIATRSDPDSVSESDMQRASLEAADIDRLHQDYQDRLLMANLKAEALRAGMIDLDGLRLIDLSAARLDKDDNVIGGQTIMAELRRNKPWLFGPSSSSSSSTAPASRPVRQKTALEMSNDEYIAARNALTRY